MLCQHKSQEAGAACVRSGLHGRVPEVLQLSGTTGFTNPKGSVALKHQASFNQRFVTCCRHGPAICLPLPARSVDGRHASTMSL